MNIGNYFSNTPLAIAFANNFLIQAFLVAMLIGAGFIFFKFFRQESVVNRTKISLDFLRRKRSGGTEIIKYRESDYRKIKDSLSMIEIKDGLIHFELDHYSP